MKKHFIELNCFIKHYQVAQISQMIGELQEKRFTLRQLEITHRALIIWDKEGLLYSSTEKGRWRKFSFFELVWIRLISKLREFNVPLKTILELKERLLSPLPLIDLVNEPKVIDTILQLAPAKHRAQAIEILSDKELIIKELSSLLLPVLFFLILDVILLKSHIAILVNLEGDFIPFKEFYIEEYQELDGFQEFIHKSHVSVSLSDIVVNFLIGQDLELTQNKLSILSKEEARIISTIREEKLSYLKIRFNKDHQIDLIESTRDQHIDKEARLIDLIMKNGYQDIEIKTEKGNIVKCQNTRKEKL
jgi:DNA-binding transcriptional MerR regulator